ncbi:MAG: Ig-like domain-containing protein [Nitrososphaera sp.]
MKYQDTKVRSPRRRNPEPFRRESAIKYPLWGLLALLVFLMPASASAAIYYLNPVSGNDSNPGTAASPWRTFRHAAQTLQAGNTAIFADGTYVETQRVVVTHSGTASAPIVFRSQNKHGAVIMFQGVQTAWGHLYTRQSYITVQDFEITQDAKGTTASDVLVYFDNTTAVLADPASTGNRFIGNKVHNAYFNTLKVYKSDNFIADGNELYDSNGIAFVATNAHNPIFRNNYIYDVSAAVAQSGAALQFKGGDRSAQVYNNVFRVKTGRTVVTALVIGGGSSANAVYDSSVNGYECFNCVAYNNVIVAEDIGSMEYGLLMSGCKDCALLNNIVIGAVWGVYLTKGNGDQAAGWAWDPKTKDPVVKNNMILNSHGTGSHTSFFLGGVGNIEGTVTHDYNLFFNAAGNNTLPPSEPNGVYTNPLLVNTLTDWHLQSGSPAITAGEAQVFIGFLGETIDVSKDKDSIQRSPVGSWDIGVYEVSAEPPTPVIPDTTPPTVTITSPAQGATVSGRVTINVLGNDNMGVTGLTQYVYVDNRLKCIGNGAELSCPWNTRKVARGLHTIEAVAKDAAGNSATITIQVTK